jgi:excisionase family DNA binding protein
MNVNMIPDDNRLLLRGTEAAAMAGVSRALMYRWMAAGTIPVFRAPGGKSMRVPRAEFLDWIRQNTQPAER